MGNYLFDHRDPYEWSKRTASSSMPPLIVCVAITGGVHGKDMNRDIATPAQAREIRGLSSTLSSY